MAEGGAPLTLKQPTEPRVAAHGIPAVTADQMRDIDRAMVEDLQANIGHQQRRGPFPISGLCS
jgi:hypothetical protein